jgi:hypothetical protein
MEDSQEGVYCSLDPGPVQSMPAVGYTDRERQRRHRATMTWFVLPRKQVRSEKRSMEKVQNIETVMWIAPAR